MSVNQTLLDQIIGKLQNLPAWNIYAIDEAADTSKPWYQVTGQIVRDLMITEATLEEQVASVSAQIMHWGRLESQARRVWVMEDRKYRQWREAISRKLHTPPADPDAAKGWKKPTEAQVESTYRTDPEYAIYQQRVERAEEAFNCTHAVLEGWRAKLEMMRLAVWRKRDNAAPTVQV